MSGNSDRSTPKCNLLKRPGRLILLRHGQSTWNQENLFAGWHDVPLSERGVTEARESGRLMKQEGLAPTVVHTSVLQRAIQTADVALEEMGLSWIPVKRSWRLNERHYGALQGRDKKETSDRYGADKVKLWRRSYDERPPDLEPTEEGHPSHDPCCAALPPELLPSAECLKDVVERMLPYWFDVIAPDLLSNECVLVCAHGNSLRALIKHLDGLSDQEVVDLDIPTGVSRAYDLGPDFRPRSWRYLGEPEEIGRRAAEVKDQARPKPTSC